MCRNVLAEEAAAGGVMTTLGIASATPFIVTDLNITICGMHILAQVPFMFLDTNFMFLDTKFMLLDSKFYVLGTKFYVLGTKF